MLLHHIRGDIGGEIAADLDACCCYLATALPRGLIDQKPLPALFLGILLRDGRSLRTFGNWGKACTNHLDMIGTSNSHNIKDMLGCPYFEYPQEVMQGMVD